jgi:hypothetical protein
MGEVTHVCREGEAVEVAEHCPELLLATEGGGWMT